MLRIEKENVDFLKEINIGLLVYKIDLADDGYEAKIDEIVLRASGYDNIVFCSVYKSDVLDYNDDIYKFYKEISKINPYVNIFIYTNGKKVARKFGNNIGINYLLKINPEDLTIINDKTLKWFGMQNSKFIINVKKIGQINNVDIYLQGIEVKKSQVYIKLDFERFDEKIFNKHPQS